jgi:hypothetical protein
MYIYATIGMCCMSYLNVGGPSTVEGDVQHVPVVAHIHCYLLMMGN